MPSYSIPPRDAEALAWMEIFAAGIAADPGRFQLTAGDAGAISAAVAAFAAGLSEAQNPELRTPVVVATKEELRASAEAMCRQFAILIKYNAGIANPDKIAIGVRPVNTSRSPVNVPESSPALTIIGATPGAHTLRYADTNTPTSAAKPFGAAQIQIYVAVADESVTEVEAAAFRAAHSRNPISVEFGSADDGKMATYFARWSNLRGDTGPWSVPVSLRIAA